jgi:hypothetical protein
MEKRLEMTDEQKHDLVNKPKHYQIRHDLEVIARHEETIISLGKALTEITNAVRGEPPAGSSWGTHDVENRVKSRLVQDEALLRQALETQK